MVHETKPKGRVSKKVQSQSHYLNTIYSFMSFSTANSSIAVIRIGVRKKKKNEKLMQIYTVHKGLCLGIQG